MADTIGKEVLDKAKASQANKCTCLTPERRGYIEAAMDFADDFPDGAFMAFMEEKGIDVYELIPFSDDHKCGKEAS